MASVRLPNFVEILLKDAGQENLIERFIGQGYVTVLDMVMVTYEELESILFVKESEVRQLIISAVNKTDVKHWLKFHGLQRYEENFKSCGLKTIGDVKGLQTVSEDLLASLEMTLPGHCKRFRAAVELLNWRPDEQEEDEAAAEAERERQLMDVVLPEAVGYWARPEFVATSTSEFLCVKGFLKSQPGEEEEELEFIVDSGSEVMTARMETIERLNLEYKHQVVSRGIHAMEERDLYIGTFRLGTEEITVEVIPDSFQSVGINVIRHFRHFMDSEKHYWHKSAWNGEDTKEEG